MANKEWGYLIKLFGVTEEGGEKQPILIKGFEAEGISAYKSVAGPYASIMKSNDYDNLANPFAIGNFIRTIGDKNTVAVKKVADEATTLIDEYNKNNQAFYGIHIVIASLEGISPKISGQARLDFIHNRASEIVLLNDAKPTYLWSESATNGSISTYYNYITFEGSKTEFLFKGEDWK